MVQAELNYTSLPKDAAINLTSTSAKVATGTKVRVEDSVFIYVKAHAALTAYVPYAYDHGGVTVDTAAPATSAAQANKIGIPQVAIASGSYGWLQIEGECEAIHIAETYAAGDHLEVLNTGVAVVVDGTTSSTTVSEKSIGVTIDAGTTAVAGTIYLYGNPVVIAAT